LVRSVIEGVSYSQKDCLVIVEELGAEARSVRASGGGAQSPLWRQILADILEKSVVTLASQEGSAYGAALLSMAGTGAYASVPEVCGAVIREVDRIEPRDHSYAVRYQTYRELYPALKPLFGRMG